MSEDEASSGSGGSFCKQQSQVNASTTAFWHKLPQHLQIATLPKYTKKTGFSWVQNSRARQMVHYIVQVALIALELLRKYVPARAASGCGAQRTGAAVCESFR